LDVLPSDVVAAHDLLNEQEGLHTGNLNAGLAQVEIVSRQGDATALQLQSLGR
jgi:hypothetical protein